MKTLALLAAILAAMSAALALGTGLPAPLIAGKLLAGWVEYLGRVVPRARWSPDGLLTGVACLALLAVGLHRFLRWWARASSPARRWKVRWTASLLATVVLTSAAGIAAVGVVHQCGWLMAPGSPRAELRIDPRSLHYGDSAHRLREIGDNVRYGLLEGGPRRSDAPDLHSWQTHILPGFFVYTAGPIRYDLPWRDPANSAYFRSVVPQFFNPEVGALRDDDGYALSHYAGNVHVLGAGGRGRRWDRGDGQTILVGESAGRFKAWGDPTNLRDPNLGISTSEEGFGGPSGEGAQLMFLDGSVRFVRKTIDPRVLGALSGGPRAGDRP